MFSSSSAGSSSQQKTTLRRSSRQPASAKGPLFLGVKRERYRKKQVPPPRNRITQTIACKKEKDRKEAGRRCKERSALLFLSLSHTHLALYISFTVMFIQQKVAAAAAAIDVIAEMLSSKGTLRASEAEPVKRREQAGPLSLSLPLFSRSRSQGG